MARKAKTNRIVIYRFMPEIEFERFDLTSKKYALLFESETKKLFLQLEKASTPPWASYIKPYLGEAAARIVNTSSSFVMIVLHEQRLYAVTGGYGFAALKDCVEEDFGLEVALRLIDEKSRILFLNQTSMKGTTRQLFRAVAGYDPLFDRENYNRILKHIEGKATFEGKMFRVSGRSCLVLRTERDIKKIDLVLEEVTTILKQDEKVHFPKSYEPVKSKNVVSILTKNFVDEFEKYWLGHSDREKFYIEVKDPLSQFKCDTYKVKYRSTAIEIHDLDLDEIRTGFLREGILVLDGLEDISRIKITGITENGFNEIDATPLIDMLVFETQIGHENFIKFGTKWYRILDEIQDYINEQLSHVPVDKNLLPEWHEGVYQREKDYNEYVARLNNWACLDQDFIYIEGRSKIELCDLFDVEENSFYHIKKTWG